MSSLLELGVDEGTLSPDQPSTPVGRAPSPTSSEQGIFHRIQELNEDEHSSSGTDAELDSPLMARHLPRVEYSAEQKTVALLEEMIKMNAMEVRNMPTSILSIVRSTMVSVRDFIAAFNNNRQINEFDMSAALCETVGLFAFFKLLLVHMKDVEVKKDVLWIISDICASQNSSFCIEPETETRLSANLVPCILSLVHPPHNEMLRMNAAWCIANILGDGLSEAVTRQILSEPNLAKDMCEVVQNTFYSIPGAVWTLGTLLTCDSSFSLQLTSNAVHVASACLNICRNSYRHCDVAKENYCKVLAQVDKLIKAVFSLDEDIVLNVLQKAPNLISEAVDMCLDLSRYCEEKEEGVVPDYLMLRAIFGVEIIAKCACVSDPVTDMLIFCGGIDCVVELLLHAADVEGSKKENKLLRHIYWALGNIASRKKEHAHKVHNSVVGAGVLEQIANEFDFDLSCQNTNSRMRFAADLLTNLQSWCFDCWSSTQIGESDQDLADAEDADMTFLPVACALTALTESVDAPTGDLSSSQTLPVSEGEGKVVVSYICLLRKYLERFDNCRFHRRLDRRSEGLKQALQKVEAFCTYPPARWSARLMLEELMI